MTPFIPFAPYNFVPHADTVLFPTADEIRHAAQDLPHPDGLCGYLDMELQADGPLLVAGGEPGSKAREKPGQAEKHAWFFKNPDGQYAIPGSSLRGMISNVLKVALFGKFNQVDDARLAMRDLTDGAKEVYQQEFCRTEPYQQQKMFVSKVKTGWLSFRDGRWHLQECEVARVERLPKLNRPMQDDNLLQWTGGGACGQSIDAQGVVDTAFGAEFYRKHAFKEGELTYQRKDLSAVYQYWQTFCSASQKPYPLIPIRFTASKDQPQEHNRKWLKYKKATELGRGKQDGTLIVTAHPGSGKHMEFIFYDSPTPAPLQAVSDVDFCTFRQAYEGAQAWQFWMDQQFRKGHIDRIPVFFLAGSGKDGPRHLLGFTQLFRLPMTLSLHDAIANTSPCHLDQRPYHAAAVSRPDRVELMFGRIPEQAATAGGESEQSPGNASPSLEGRNWFGKGRVDFSLAPCQNPPGEIQVRSACVIPGTPKPGFYPNYIRQSSALAGGTGGGNRAAGSAAAPANNAMQQKLAQALQRPATVQATAPNPCAPVRKAVPAPLGKFLTLLHPQAQLRGWKRYQVKCFDEEGLATMTAAVAQLKPPQKMKQTTTLHFITPASPAKPLRFTVRMHFHNLSPFELGALLWVLSWGGDDKLFHSLGMGKAYGAGAVRFFAQQLVWRENQKLQGGFQCENNAAMQKNDSQFLRWREAFVRQMDGLLHTTWQHSEQINSLLALATRREKRDLGRFRYMKLEMKGENQFLEVKKGYLGLPGPLETAGRR